MKLLRVLLLIALFLTTTLSAVERKEVKDIISDDFTVETQAINSEQGFNLVWWIPIEFWETAFSSDPNITAAQVKELVDLLKPYSMLAVVQADVSSLGAFNFYDREKMLSALSITYTNEKKSASKLKVLTDIPPDVDLLLQQMRPILTAAMGNMGKSMEFFVLSDFENKKRVIDPYKHGELNIGLLEKKNDITLTIKTPLNSLFVPRKCPNQKDAHISWNYCPWDGSKLKD